MVDDAKLINVVDLEATCFKPWRGETQDIIEVGISVVNPSTNSILTTASILVKPTNSAITSFCTSLTTLTPEQVEEGGVTFTEAMRILTEQYHLSTRLFASYGAFDIKLIKKQVEREGVDVKLPVSFLNVKKLVAVSYNRNKQCGMMKALNICGLDHEGVHHRGDDDSYNTSNILLHLMKRHVKDKVFLKSIERVTHVK